MLDFTITDKILSQIANDYELDEDIVKKIHKLYKNVNSEITQQYLAHIIRTMEEYLRKLPGNEMFYIRCLPIDETFENIGIAESYYNKNRLFIIYYHPQTEEKQLRIQLAHELGHLFLIELLNAKKDKDFFDVKTDTEPLATILGIFIIFDKNDFYHNKTVAFKHKTSDEILKDFALLDNRKNKKYNSHN